jgi:hypothetical protein
MAAISVKQHIRASAEAVFDAASDFANAPGRIKGIKKMEILTPGEIGKGTRFKETRVMFGKEATEEMEVTSFDRPSGYSLGCESCGCRYHCEFRFTPRGEGTDVEMTFNAQPLTLIAKIMGFLMAPMMKGMLKTCAKDLDDLREYVEQNPVTT